LYFNSVVPSNELNDKNPRIILALIGRIENSNKHKKIGDKIERILGMSSSTFNIN
jgi:hypothetical protein